MFEQNKKRRTEIKQTLFIVDVPKYMQLYLPAKIIHSSTHKIFFFVVSNNANIKKNKNIIIEKSALELVLIETAHFFFWSRKTNYGMYFCCMNTGGHLSSHQNRWMYKIQNHQITHHFPSICKLCKYEARNTWKL